MDDFEEYYERYLQDNEGSLGTGNVSVPILLNDPFVILVIIGSALSVQYFDLGGYENTVIFLGWLFRWIYIFIGLFTLLVGIVSVNRKLISFSLMRYNKGFLGYWLKKSKTLSRLNEFLILLMSIGLLMWAILQCPSDQLLGVAVLTSLFGRYMFMIACKTRAYEYEHMLAKRHLQGGKHEEESGEEGGKEGSEEGPKKDS